MKKIIYLLVSVILLSSCSGGLYSHYPKVKRNAQTETVKKEKIKKEEAIAQTETPTEIINQLVEDDIETPLHEIAPAEPTAVTPQKPTKTKVVKFKKGPITIVSQLLRKKDAALSATPEKGDPVKHKEARQSLVLALVGWGCALLSVVFILFGVAALVLEIIALVNGINASKEIKQNPDAYNNRGDATAGIVLSSVYLGLLVLAILLIIAFIAFTGFLL